MNREIKFRAWDREEEKMYSQMYMLQAFPTNVLLDILLQDGMWDYNLMQYTGLKDKNGKEIYEGDIVRYHRRDYETYDSDYLRDFTIVWNDGGFYGKGSKIRLGNIAGEYSEVIGNIYENPELLEENK